ncbi:hypothetical protein BDZ91DRAFT_13428 [Kalaharituber pfeilii]|nr:hypothetical protein BDZ91DRAFT_13428 [Kalaharituber pfeilii]
MRANCLFLLSMMEQTCGGGISVLLIFCNDVSFLHYFSIVVTLSTWLAEKLISFYKKRSKIKTDCSGSTRI